MVGRTSRAIATKRQPDEQRHANVITGRIYRFDSLL
jgi:hypothetical protein